jgi:hypothetical protein
MNTPAGREGSQVGWQRSDRCLGFLSIFSRALLSLYANQVCRKQHSGWLCLQHSDWLRPSPYTVLLLVCPILSSFHPLRSQGGHSGDFQGLFCLSDMDCPRSQAIKCLYTCYLGPPSPAAHTLLHAPLSLLKNANGNPLNFSGFPCPFKTHRTS